MRILYVITQADGGGAQKYTLTLARHFNGTIAAGTEDDKLFDAAERAGVKTFPLQHLKRKINPVQDFLAMLEIRLLIKNLNPDIVHLNSSKAGVLGSFAAIGLKKKVVFTAHGFIFNEPLPWALKSFYLALEKVASDFRDFIITVSNADKKSALDNKLINPGKIQTIHNGIEPIEFIEKNSARSTLGLSEDRFVFGTIANAYRTKGLDVLIKAISMLSDETKNKCEFVIIGDGPEFKNLEFRIRNLGLQKTVKLLGKIHDANKYLKAFNAFILPSRKEGFPYTLLEAMQAGLPIIASSVGGNPEALGDSAELIPAQDPKALAEAITRMVTDETIRTLLSQKALERSKLFTQTKMLEETKKVYSSLL